MKPKTIFKVTYKTRTCILEKKKIIELLESEIETVYHLEEGKYRDHDGKTRQYVTLTLDGRAQ